MKCIYCGHEKTKVVDTRDTAKKTRRRRECKECGRRFTTYETAETFDIKVEKKDGELEEFKEEKIREGIEKAVKNTPVTEDQIEEIVEEVKEGIRGNKQVHVDEIGELVKEALLERNEVAYIRFASVYESYDDIDSFQKEVEELKNKA